MLRDEDEAVEVQLHIDSVDRLLVQHDQPGGPCQEDLLCGGEQSKPDVPEGQESEAQLDVVQFLWVGLNIIVEGVEALELDPIDDRAGPHPAEEDLPLIDCPVACRVEVVRVPAAAEFQT